MRGCLRAENAKLLKCGGRLSALARMKFTWSADKTLVAATLNIGGRNTNPLEFLLDGDSSEEGAAATKALNRAQEAMVDAECGPARMAESERAVVIETLDMIFEELQGDRNYIDELLNAATWANVYDQVRRERHGLFNALNLSTIKMQRPSVIIAFESTHGGSRQTGRPNC